MSTRGHIRWHILLAVGVAYALVVGLMTLPASLHLSQRLIGNNIDNWIFYWNNWWLEKAIKEGHNWFFTPYLFYPNGTSLVAHSNSFLSALLALLVKPLAGPIVAYNLVLLFRLWVGAVGMFLFVYESSHCSSAALLAGFIFAFTPYHLTQLLSHAHLGSIHWWPFYALFLRRTLLGHQAKRRRLSSKVYRDQVRPLQRRILLCRVTDTLGAGLFAALTLWSGRQLAVLLALWTALYLSWLLLHAWFLQRKTGAHTGYERSCIRMVGAAGLVGIVALALSWPMVLPVAKEWSRLAEEATAFNESESDQTDLLAYFVPPTYHPLAGPRVVRLYERFIANKVAMPYLGYTVLGLAFASLGLQRACSRRTEAGFWLLGTGFWMVLAAGSVPRLNGTLYPHIPLPYRMVGQVFPISAIRSPDRFNLLTVFSLSVSAGLGAAYLVRRRRWLSIPVVLLVIAEYLCVPLPAWNADIPPASPFFEQMAQEKAEYGVVDYPMGYTMSKLWLYYQTLHDKPLVEGHVSRYTPEDYAFIASQPLLQALYQTAKEPIRIPREMFEPEGQTALVSALGPALRSLDASGVRYVLLHKPYLDPTLLAHFRDVLPLVPAYEDATLAVYDVADPLPIYYDGFPITLTPDVALARFAVQHDDANTGWRFEVIVTPLTSRVSPHMCQIQLIGEEGSVLASPITFFEELQNGETWKMGDPEVREVKTVIPQELETGSYHWTVTCPEAAAGYTAPETLQVHADGRITYLRHSANLRYGETIEFLGYRWWTTGAELHVALWWKALEPPPADYKVFVQLLNTNGEIVRQYDAMPCNWQCPTSRWQAGEIVSDQAVISLGRLSPEEYHLIVGLYDAKTLKRLPIHGPEGEPYPDDYFTLPDAFSVSWSR